MSTRKLNVLVYTGTGTTIASVRQCIYTLRRLLSPNYAVIPLTESALLKEPWAPTAVLLVVPGGADLNYCRVLNGTGNRIIDAFVRRGGSYLGFCAGGYYGCARCEFEVGHPERGMEVVGSRELGFFLGTCRGGAFAGFRYASEVGARAVRLDVRKEAFAGAGVLPESFRSYYNGGGVFVDAGRMGEAGVEVLASYEEELNVDGGEGTAALVYCKVGAGGVILTGPHPEFAAVNLEPHPDVEGYDEVISALAEDDEHRTNFLKACLAKLGLEVNHDNTSIPSLSKLYLSALDPEVVGGLLTSFDTIIDKDGKGRELIRGENDTFLIERQDSRWEAVDDLSSALESAHISTKDSGAAKSRYDAGQAAAVDGLVDYNKVLKTVVPHETSWPGPKETPYFNHADYYASLQEFRRREAEAYEWGDTLMYGEVVTSTNTLLEKNTSLLAQLPTGFTMAATTQIAGRGRGTNVWIAPPGCMIFSTVVNHPAHLGQDRPVVFIQYLAAIAIVEAVRSYDGRLRDGAYADIPIRLKWPNDVYAQDPANPWRDTAKKVPNFVKIGGILTNCAYSAGNYQMVVGVGINTTNGQPTTSLDALLTRFSQRHNLPPFRIERLLARLLTRFESLYRDFVRNGFTRDMEERYYDAWLHSGQVVTLEAEGGVTAKVVGITRDWGLLKAQELGIDGRATGKVWALQSDENSFDFWKGLVKRKV
ncbi:class II aaRS and biotin synthetase [Cryphonectria parasitica EP155]|uniref:Class II aaRS and biotin synthetase n=1 Tax=Cryphonectria parasitica (strain ATCC 38755 / EP155) TaxID=660469 RepID=A0A9P5CLC1_CRYP1|nr:class II aaRS and biotin synthetase [Cryphonectria parasitica EP155]KAF3761675.1 class II aaRS and biotin synthetase [Cryphonectria parasitica EP155]